MRRSAVAAETCTASASAWFERGFVTYSNEAKTELLGKVNAFNTLSIYNLCDGEELFSFKSINVSTKKTIDPPVEVGSIDHPQTKQLITRHIIKNKHAKTTRERLLKEELEQLRTASRAAMTFSTL